jgi:TonB family protein
MGERFRPAAVVAAACVFAMWTSPTLAAAESASSCESAPLWKIGAPPFRLSGDNIRTPLNVTTDELQEPITATCCISEEGTVFACKLNKSAARLESEIVPKLQTWFVEPFLLEGKPRVVRVNFPLAGAKPDKHEPVAFGEEMTPPVKLAGRAPSYTRAAVEARVEGTMIVRCVITVAGTLEKCQILEHLPGMTDEIMSALATWKMKPVTYKGKAIPVRYTIPIRLVLPKTDAVAPARAQ